MAREVASHIACAGRNSGTQLAASSPILFSLELQVPLGDCSHSGWGLPFSALPLSQETPSQTFLLRGVSMAIPGPVKMEGSQR